MGIAHGSRGRSSRMAEAANRRTLDVLILDDEPKIASALRRALQRWHTVRCAATPEEALAHLELRVPDVLLSDFQLAECTAAELLRSAKARWPSIRCVLHSASRAELWAALLEEGIVERILRKPASITEILDSLEPA